MSSLTKHALQKIGRSVLGYQRIEWMLKQMVLHARILGTPSGTLEGNPDTTKKKTLGPRIEDYFNTLFSPADNSKLDERNEPYFAFSFHIGLTEEQLKPWRKSFKQLLDDRNELIHVRLGTFNRTDSNQCLDLINELDTQHKRLKTFHDNLREQFLLILDSRKELAEFMMAEEFLNFLLEKDQPPIEGNIE